MFRISRRLDYGIQLMAALAADEQNRPQSTATFAEKLDMPLPFLHQIAHGLMQAGLIKATPGQKGGLRLSYSANEITILQIVEALEGPIGLSPCSECPEDCARQQTCATHLIWDSMQQRFTEYLQNIHLDQLCSGNEIEMILNKSDKKIAQNNSLNLN